MDILFRQIPILRQLIPAVTVQEALHDAAVGACAGVVVTAATGSFSLGLVASAVPNVMRYLRMVVKAVSTPRSEWDVTTAELIATADQLLSYHADGYHLDNLIQGGRHVPIFVTPAPSDVFLSTITHKAVDPTVKDIVLHGFKRTYLGVMLVAEERFTVSYELLNYLIDRYNAPFDFDSAADEIRRLTVLETPRQYPKLREDTVRLIHQLNDPNFRPAPGDHAVHGIIEPITTGTVLKMYCTCLAVSAITSLVSRVLIFRLIPYLILRIVSPTVGRLAVISKELACLVLTFTIKVFSAMRFGSE